MDRKNRPRSGGTDLARVNRAAEARCIHAHMELRGEKDHQDRHRPNIDSLTLHIHDPNRNQSMGEKVVSSSGRSMASNHNHGRLARIAGYFAAMRMAPSNRIVAPFSILFSMMCCTRAAYSPGWPRRRGKGTCSPSEAIASAGKPANSGVLKIPGAIVTTRIP